MLTVWQLQEAKSRFSEMINSALQEGPQVITRHGVEVAIVLSATEYRKLSKPARKLSEFFRESPLANLDLDFSRDPDTATREIAL